MTEEEWLGCTDLNLMLDFLREKVSDRKLRLFGVACCRRIWHLMNDSRSRNAVLVGERWADERATANELAQARDAAWDVIMDDSSCEVCSAAWNVVREEAWDVACRSGDVAAWETAWAAVPKGKDEGGNEWDSDPTIEETSRQAIKEAEDREQTLLLHDIFGNPLRSVSINPAWLTPTVINLATIAYEERSVPYGDLDVMRLAVLSDALEEASCNNADMLTHLRGAGPHVRGCWVVDLLLGRH